MPNQPFPLKRRRMLALACAVPVVLAGCANDPLTAFNHAWNKDAKGTVQLIDNPPILQIRVPKEQGIHIHSIGAQPAGFVQVRDLVYNSIVMRNAPIGFFGQAAPVLRVQATASESRSFARILFESPQNGSFTVHGRNDNGAAGSGIKYWVQYTIADNPGDYVVSFRPATREVYEQGIGIQIVKIPVPDFKVGDVLTALTNTGIVYTFEIDSPYPTDSVTANFMRSPAVQRVQGSYKDPVTGKIIGTAYQLPMGGVTATFSVEAYPYRNGSKAVITALILAKLTSPGMVDFKLLADQVKTAVTSIVQS